MAQPIDYAELSRNLLTQMLTFNQAEKQGGQQHAYGLYGIKHTQPTGTPVQTGLAHGAGGLFSTPGVEPDVYSAIPMPTRGLLSMLPWSKSNSQTPLFDILTGVTATTGSEKTNVCDDPPTAGLVKLCRQTSYFGRWERQTREFEINRLGQQRDRHDPMDLRLVNNPLAPSDFGNIVPDVPGGVNAQKMLLDEVNKLKFELLIAFARDHSTQVYAGNPALNTSGGGHQQIVGLDIQINTGLVDAISNVACPAADSFIINHNYGLVGSNPSIVTAVVAMMHLLKQNAMLTKLDPVTWALSMRPQLFYELTNIWPCSYFTAGCTVASTTTPGMLNLQDMVTLRDAMRQGSYLLIDGEQVPVVQDIAIDEDYEADAAALDPGQYASDIYFVPLTVLGGIPVTYLEYYDQSNATAQQLFGDMRLGQYFWTSNGGAYLWTAKPPRMWCIQWALKMEPRLVLRTPFIAGRIQNVRYQPYRHDRDVYPSDPYFTDGGQSTGDVSGSYFTNWGVGTGHPSMR